MKRFLLLFMAVAMVGLVGCSKDDDDNGGGGDSALVGKWEAVAEYELKNGNWTLDYTYSSNQCVYTFTETKLTIKDSADVLNGQTIGYSYNTSSKKLTVAGMSFDVHKLTSTEFEMGGISITNEGTVETKTVFKKVE